MTEKEQKAIISRLHRISGQVAGIEKMVSEGALLRRRSSSRSTL